MTLNSTSGANGVSVVSGSRITFDHPGTYDIQFSAQLHNTGGGGSGRSVDIWLAKNGDFLPDTDTQVDVNTIAHMCCSMGLSSRR